MASVLQPIQPGDMWAVAYGYHIVQGIEIAKQVDGGKTTWSLHAFGEGEWDGLDAVWVNERLVYPEDKPWRVQFHPGKDGTLGGGLAATSTGGDQNVDTRFLKWPLIQPVTLSRIAYMTLASPFDPGAPSADLNVVVYARTKKVRTFDNAGNQLTYAFSTNPWWILLDVLINNFIQREATFNTALTAQEKQRINFASFATEAAYADTVLGSGAKRFECSVAFPASTNLANAIEQILLCARGYLIEVNGQFTAASDKTKASSFTLTAQHVVPGSFNMEKKLARPAADHFNGNYRDLNTAVLTQLSSVVIDAAGKLHFITTGSHGRQIGDSIEIDNCSHNAGYNGKYVVAGSGHPNALMVTTSPNLDPAGTYATTGQMVQPETKFATRQEMADHIAHQQSIGQRGAGLSVQPNAVGVDLDYGNNTQERVQRLLVFQKRRTFGDDTTPYNGPWEGHCKAFYDAVDPAGNRLIDQLCGDFITIDRSVSEEFQGLSEILEFTLPQMQVHGGQSSAASGADLEVELYLKQVVADAYSDDGGDLASINPASNYLAPKDPNLATNSCIIHLLRDNPAVPRTRPSYSFRPISLFPYTVQVGDILEYDIYLDGNSADFRYALDIVDANGNNPPGWFPNYVDQNGLYAQSSNFDGFFYASDRWYHRAIDISAFAGNTIAKWLSSWYPVGNNTPGAPCRGRIANVKVTNGGGLQAAIFNMQYLGPSLIYAEQDVIDVRVYTADNGIVALPSFGKGLLPNPGFESNVAGVQTNVFQSTPLQILIDGWTLEVGNQYMPVCIEDSGTPHGGLRNLFFRIPTATALPVGSFASKIDSDILPCVPGDVLAWGCWLKASGVALPAGLTVQCFVYLDFIDARGNLITPYNAGQIIEQDGNSYGYLQVQQQYVAPANAAAVRVAIGSQFVNASGVINTGANLYCDLRADDFFLINRTQSFDSSPLDSSATVVGTYPILTQHALTTQIDVAAFSVQRGFGSIAYNSGSVNPGAYGHYYVYFKDPTYSGGAVTFLAAPAASIGSLTGDGSIVLVGDLTTAGGGGGSGGTGIDGGRGGARR